MKKYKLKLDKNITNQLLDEHKTSSELILKEASKLFNDICKYNYQILKMQLNIFRHTDDVWSPPLNTNLDIINNSWFSIKESASNDFEYTAKEHTFDKYECPLFKCKKVELHLNNSQKKIINEWLYAYMKMYNEALKKIKTHYKESGTLLLNDIKLRALLMNEKANIISKSTENKNTAIKVHDIDYAISLACSNYKSAVTNLKNGNIKSFRLRYWTNNKDIKMMECEKDNFKSGSIRKAVLGIVKGTYNNKQFDFKTINKDCKILYNKLTDRYQLLVPEDVIKSEPIQNNEFISLDPGVRTFMTGISENKVIKIEDEHNCRLKSYIYRKERIMNDSAIDMKIKKKNEKLCNRKIKNLVTEMHWQTINYLTTNYKNIFIGDMSPKKIISNEKSQQLKPITKKIISAYRFFEFKNKLTYKCAIRRVKYKEVDERYTSKMCSKCGSIKENLGASKIFQCDKCGYCTDRDVNGSRNIYIKSIN
jgi:transposase